MVRQLLLLSTRTPSPSHVLRFTQPRQCPTYLSPFHSSFVPISTGFRLATTTAPQKSTNATTLNKRPPPVVKYQSSDYFEQSQPRFSPSNSPRSTTPASLPGLPPKVFVGHSIYKGKAALKVAPKAPEFLPLESGAYKISRDGCVMLEFAPAIGVRQYDWSKKLVFSLSVPEIGSLISLSPSESCEFFHDPNKGKGDEGKVRKVLKVDALPDGSNRMFNLSVQNRILNIDEYIKIPISKAEFAVLVSAFNFVLPYLLGWSTFADAIKPEASRQVNTTSPRGRVDYEWSR